MRRGGGYGGHESSEGFWGALGGVWFSPRRFFERLDPEGGFFRPVLFASIILYLNLILDSVLQAIWLQEFNYALIYTVILGLPVALILAPILVAGLSALVLVVLDGSPSRAKFGPVFRNLCYASGAGVVIWVPLGPILATVCGAYAATIAVKEALNESWNRAAAAALIPLGAVIVILLLFTGFDEAATFFFNPPDR
ncbi:MAG: YIP1 family protein [Rubrobacter sp.]|nr:YIP1 family protein [Rubrobacter sp.]